MSIQFSDTSTKNGLIQVCEDLIFGNYGDISGNSDRLYQFTRLLNEALNRVTSLILTADGRWQFDDTNYTDIPIGTTNLVTTAGSEQQDYAFAATHLKITRVECMDSTGAWHLLQPIDQAQLYNQSLTDFMNTAGFPTYYDKIGNSIFLYPKPLAAAVTATAGLKVFFQRPPSYFSYTDTTKTPGFNSMYHELVALIASKNYAISKSLPVAGGVMRGGFKTGLLARVDEAEQDLIDSYALRNKDDHLKMRARVINYS